MPKTPVKEKISEKAVQTILAGGVAKVVAREALKHVHSTEFYQQILLALHEFPFPGTQNIVDEISLAIQVSCFLYFPGKVGLIIFHLLKQMIVLMLFIFYPQDSVSQSGFFLPLQKLDGLYTKSRKL